MPLRKLFVIALLLCLNRCGLKVLESITWPFLSASINLFKNTQTRQFIHNLTQMHQFYDEHVFYFFRLLRLRVTQLSWYHSNGKHLNYFKRSHIDLFYFALFYLIFKDLWYDENTEQINKTGNDIIEKTPADPHDCKTLKVSKALKITGHLTFLWGKVMFKV